MSSRKKSLELNAEGYLDPFLTLEPDDDTFTGRKDVWGFKLNFFYLLFVLGGFWSNEEHARSWELLVVYSASLSLLERMLRGNRARLSVNYLVSFQLHSASQLISCAIRIDLKIMQRCTGKWGPILLSPFFVMGPFFTFVESAHASCEKTTMCVFWE